MRASVCVCVWRDANENLIFSRIRARGYKQPVGGSFESAAAAAVETGFIKV